MPPSCPDPLFRTPVPVCTEPPFRLDARQGVLLVGSCFTDNIGGRLIECGVPACVNPAGVQYNPASIAALLRAAMELRLPEGASFRFQERTRCWLFPTRFSSADPAEAEAIFSDTLQTLHDALLQCPALAVTLGTAWVYEHIASPASDYSGIVGNCHKVPASEFRRRRLLPEEIVALWRELLADLQDFRSRNGAGEALKVIFTVSPIRHFRDGAAQNTLSKATLHLSVHTLLESLSACHNLMPDYFPAYELLMDDLRDYRFYADDMLHPSATAIAYIWDHFRYTYYTPSDCAGMNLAARAYRAAAHRTLLR